MCTDQRRCKRHAWDDGRQEKDRGKCYDRGEIVIVGAFEDDGMMLAT